jgi:N-acylneuraminate cytidylyltransferase
MAGGLHGEPMTEILAIIPARGGSKGIPRKNIRLFSGWPLLAWSIAAARQSRSISRVIVSTDDEEIAGVARQFNAEVPFLRPAEFAKDDSIDLPAFQHALEWLDKHEGYHPETVVQLRPTSPLRPSSLVDDAVIVLERHPDADSVRGVVPAGQNPYKMWRLQGPEVPMKNLIDAPGVAEPYNAPRQILPPVFWQTGHIDVIRTSTILEKGSMSGEVIYPLIIDSRFAVDIDNSQDWLKYEYLLSTGMLDCVTPGRPRRKMPENLKMIICDFDGVITDNLVLTDETGKEAVMASRSDSMRVRELRNRGIEVMILSSEPNPVVKARAEKMGVEAIHGIDISSKGEALKGLLKDKKVDGSQIIYIGNDFNDLPCFEIAGWAVAVADAFPEVLQAADHVLSRPGGHGAVRELCELVIRSMK